MKELLALAKGLKPADLVVNNGKIVNVYSGEIYDGGVAVCGDKIASLVTAMHSNNIQSTMCNGKWLMRDRVILTLDEEAILKEACARGAAIYDRAGIKLPDRFPVVKV